MSGRVAASESTSLLPKNPLKKCKPPEVMGKKVKESKVREMSIHEKNQIHQFESKFKANKK